MCTEEISSNRKKEVLVKGVTNADASYTFYYDESNNDRKIRLNNGELNVKTLKNFVLGGIVNIDDSKIDLNDFKKKINYQENQGELKFENFGKDGFLAILGTVKLSHFLRWMLNTSFVVHYFNINPLYWGVVDIIDSIYPFVSPKLDHGMMMKLKSDLYYAVDCSLDEFVEIVHQFDYPNIPQEKTESFIDKLIELVSREEYALESFWKNNLISLLNMGKELSELSFIQGFEKHYFVASFAPFYRERIKLFVYSNHVFDEEDQVQPEISAIQMTNNGVPVNNYSFEKSVNNEYIQVSDLVAGLFGKYFTFIKDTSTDELCDIKRNLTDSQRKNIDMMRQLVDKSLQVSTGTEFKLVPLAEDIKHKFFMHGLNISGMSLP